MKLRRVLRLVGSLLAASIATHAFAQALKLVEKTERLKAGDGLWMSRGGWGDFAR
jgi:hypothetical protein